jgi:hypothetical protein
MMVLLKLAVVDIVFIEHQMLYDQKTGCFDG